MTKLPFTLLGALLALQLGVGGPASAAEPSVNGEVTKIDESAGKITIRHGAIKNLDMEPMTMVFRVKEPAMLKEVKPGDKIKFEADRVNGAITVTEMKVAK
jgi:Cu(I)/Ag(I) efflux system periplasmic protein CusF